MRKKTKRYFRGIGRLTLSDPCPSVTALKRGPGNVSFCDRCQKNVHHLSKLTRREAARVFAEHDGNLCVSFFRNPDGTVRYRSDPPRRLRWVAGSALSFLSAFSREKANAEPPVLPSKEARAPAEPAVESGLECNDPDFDSRTEKSAQNEWDGFDLIETAEAQGGGPVGSYGEAELGEWNSDGESTFGRYCQKAATAAVHGVRFGISAMLAISTWLLYRVFRRKHAGPSLPAEQPPV